MRTIELPDEILTLLQDSRLAGRSKNDQVRVAVAIHPFQEERISIGKAAELADVPRAEFKLLLIEMGIPVVRYDLEDYETNLRGIAAARRHETQ